MLETIRRVRNLATAVAAIFTAALSVAVVVEAPQWLLITFVEIALFGAVLTVLLLWLEHGAEREGDAARLEQEREKEAAARFASAAALLDDRVGAVHLLEGLARDAPDKYQGPIVELLSAHIRRRSPWPPRDADERASTPIGKRRPPPDVQAALRVLGRRDHLRDPPGTEIRLSDVDLRGATLRGGHFEGARFRRSHLEGARLEGAHLERAKFRAAHLEGAHLDHDDDSSLPAAHLDGAEFPEAVYDRRTRWPGGFDPEAAACRRADVHAPDVA